MQSILALQPHVPLKQSGPGMQLIAQLAQTPPLVPQLLGSVVPMTQFEPSQQPPLQGTGPEQFVPQVAPLHACPVMQSLALLQPQTPELRQTGLFPMHGETHAPPLLPHAPGVLPG